MLIKIDNREHTLIKLVKALNNDYDLKFTIEVEQMDLGDATIVDKNGKDIVLLERKKLSDLASSIKDGRYAEQSYRLNGYPLHNHNIVYLIEGNVSQYNDKWTRVKPSTLYTTMFSLQYYKGFSVVRTFDITETAEYILRISDKIRRSKNKVPFYTLGEKNMQANKWTSPSSYVGVVHKEKKKNITPQNIGGIILSQIPGISTATSKVLMDKFGSLFQLLKALEKDKQCLDKLCYKTKTGQERRISKTSISNIIQYLFYQKSNVIHIDT